MQTRLFAGAVRRDLASALTLLVGLALVAGLLVSPAAASDAAALSTIAGKVTRDSSGGDSIADALVIAAPYPLPAKTGAGGEFSIGALPDGSYELTVQPDPSEIPPTVSPTWVFEGEPALVGTPPSVAGVSLVVRTASVTVQGDLNPPPGDSVDFSQAGQRAWVRAENQEGRGNTVQVDASGGFSIKVLPGVVIVRVYLENSAYAAPLSLSGAVYHAEEGQTVTVEPLTLAEKSAQISGVVRLLDSATTAPAGITVRAWRLDGADFEETSTQAGGVFAMHVISGTWAIRAVPEANRDYPLGSGDYYVPAQSPEVVVLESDTASVMNLDLRIAEADVSVSGRAVKPDGSDYAALEQGAIDGRVYTLYWQDGRPQLGPTAPLTDAAFTNLRLASSVATTYTVGIYFPPETPYTALARPPLLLNQPIEPMQSTTIPVQLDNSHITGTLRERGSGSYPSGLPGVVWAASNSGGWARTRINPQTGAYDLQVSTTDVRGQGGSLWRVRPYVDPTRGYLVQQPRVQRVFLEYNADDGDTAENVDFTLVSIASLRTVSGRVTGPSGEPLAGVRVLLRELTGDVTAGVSRSTLTRADGRYEIAVPPGTYRVSARLGAPRNLLRPDVVAPAPLTAVVGNANVGDQNLAFRSANALLTGRVTYAASTRGDKGWPALVRARAADGVTEFAATLPPPTGAYALGLLRGQGWTVEAVGYERDPATGVNYLLRSEPVTLTPGALNPALNLELVRVAEIPESQAFVFDAALDQVFVLADGSSVQVPAGAMGVDGKVLLTVAPLADLASDDDVQPIGFGYRLHAFVDEPGAEVHRQQITRFARPVTLVIPFTAAQLGELGITADRLVPSYWDAGSSSWKPVESVSVSVDAAGGGTVAIVVDHFTDYAILGAPGGTIFLPYAARR